MSIIIPKNIDSLLKILSKDDSLFGEIYIENEEVLRIVVEPDRIDEIDWGKEQGIAFRKISENFKNYFGYSSQFDEEVLENLVKGLIKEESFNSSERTGFKTGEKLEEEKTYKKFLEERFYFLENIKKKIKKTKEIKHYKVLMNESKKEVLILNSEGSFIEQVRYYFRLGILVVVEKDGKLERGYDVLGKTLPFDKIVEVPEFLELPEKVSNLALIMLSAKKVPAGVMPVVLSSEAGGTMIHEAVGHGLEADHAEEGFSVYSGKIGEKVASELITVVDDATLENLYGSYKIDDEGIPSQKVILIEKGILKNFLYDRYFALKYGKISNGHGRRENFRHIPLPRMANTYIEKGAHNPEDIIKSIDKGLLIKKMGGGEVNPLTGDFVFEVREGYFIDKGEIVYPVKGVTLVGNGPQVLKMIDMVGNDLEFSCGMCGKDDQIVPVADGQPTLRIPEITVGGLVE